MMRVWTCDDHDGIWPVPTASVIVADTDEEANSLLAKALQDRGLSSEYFTLKELDLTTAHVVVLSDGNY